VGTPVAIQDKASGVITRVAPPLIRRRKKSKYDWCNARHNTLTNGQSVTFYEPRQSPVSTKAPARITIPLSALKIGAESVDVFTLGTSSALVAHQVTLGSLLGDRVEITAGLTPDMDIVTDARGLREGETVNSNSMKHETLCSAEGLKTKLYFLLKNQPSHAVAFRKGFQTSTCASFILLINICSFLEIFVERRQFTILVIGALVIWGGVAVFKITKESTPEVSIPVGVVSSYFRGIAEDVERLVTNRLNKISPIFRTSTNDIGISRKPLHRHHRIYE